MDRVVLTNGDARAELAPSLGGSVLSFTVGGRDVMRPTPEGATDVLASACFPLVPYCNRIRDGVFTFEGETVRLKPNMGDHPHALHGKAWRGAWTAAAVSSDRAVLTYEHAPDDWPWAFRAEQTFSLREDGLRIELSVVNTDHRPMPAGLGLHPAFPATGATRFKAQTDGVWLVDDAPLPVSHHAGIWGRDWAAGAPIAGQELIDHCFTGWRGPAEISEPGLGSTVITASPECRWLHVYIPPRQGFLCVEPVTHMPDPFARDGSGIQVLAPGAGLSIHMDVAWSSGAAKTR